MRVTIDHVFNILRNELACNNQGSIQFTLANVGIIVKQNNVVGNIIEEWLDSWMSDKGFEHEYNHGQCSPDFWLDLNDRNKEWLEVKSFTGSANFDIANFMSYIQEIIDKPWKLDSKYLCIKYSMNKDSGIVTIDNVWLKRIWEIATTSSKWAVKMQDKRGVIYNIRPASWYINNCRVFERMEDFLSALDYVIKRYPPTSSIGMNWKSRVERAYSSYSGAPLNIPLWQDIANNYGWTER